MHWLDTTILAALSLGAVLGFASGLFWQLARIGSFVAAIYATLYLHEPAADFLRDKLLRDADPNVIKAGAYLVVFLATYLSLFVFTRVLRSWIRATELAPLDRLLGAGLGLAKISLIVAAACWILPYCPHPAPKDWHEQSTLAPIFARGLDAALSHVPDDYKQPILDGFQTWRDSATSVKS